MNSSTAPDTSGPVLENLRLVSTTTGLLLAAALVAAGGSLFFPDLLLGEAVVDGNLRGTALVVLALAIPTALDALRSAARQSSRGLVVLVGTVAYLTYQGVMFCFGTPFNDLFLAYVALLGCGVWTLVVLVSCIDRDRFTTAIGPRFPFRVTGAALATFATLNALAWLARILPATFGDGPARGLEDSGLLTSPVWVQDLAFWLPAAVLAAVLVWRRRPLGVLLATAALTYYALEALSVASDQWWGARADSTHPDLASADVVPAAVAVAVVVVALLLGALRHLDARSSAPVRHGARRSTEKLRRR